MVPRPLMLSCQSIIHESRSEKMAMEAAPTSPQMSNFAPQNTAAVSHTVPVSHTTVNLIQPDQGKGLYIVDPSQQHAALQMFGNPDQRFMANPVEFNPTGPITTTAVSNGNAQITMVSFLYELHCSIFCFLALAGC